MRILRQAPSDDYLAVAGDMRRLIGTPASKLLAS